MPFQNTKIQVVTASLALVLSLAYFGNQRMVGSSQIANGRAPASMAGAMTLNSTSLEKLNMAEENELAKEVAPKSAARSLASIGQPANEIENLKFGILEGKYAFKMSGEVISEISLNEAEMNNPTIITNRADFLAKYASQFGANSKPQKLSSVQRGEHIIETYKVKLANGSDQLIQVTIGASNSLLALKTQEAPKLNLF